MWGTLSSLLSSLRGALLGPLSSGQALGTRNSRQGDACWKPIAESCLKRLGGLSHLDAYTLRATVAVNREIQRIPHPLPVQGTLRSEERRVGKECRSRWSPYH